MRKILFAITIMFLFSCETEEQKKEKAQEVVNALISNIQVDNYESIFEYYPNFKGIGTYLKYNSVEFTSTMLKSDGKVDIFGKTYNGKQLFFEVEKTDGIYKVIKSKGLSSYYDSNLYKYCKKIGCIGMNEYDTDISRICKDNEGDFNFLVNSIKDKIESKTRLESHTITRKNGGFGYYYAFGDITVKNNSRFTIPGYSYKLYVNYLDSNDNLLFTSDKSSGNFTDIGFNQSKTLNIYQDISSRFRKVNIKVKLLNTEFIEKLIAEYAEGSLCNYSNNL
ncbi:MAG: hypothetical protein V7734_07630 [Maribacter arcticus]|uniref:hypothetical protein n=1 Tax=Maribacter arcticus TaxID=561365 RepID=UPI003000FDB5